LAESWVELRNNHPFYA
jgi:hypothetical protein